MEQKNEEEAVDLDADLDNDFVEEFHIETRKKKR